MRAYSAEFKASLIAKMLPPNNRSIPDLVRETQIPRDTLYHCRTPDLAPNSMRLDRLKHEAQLGTGVDRPLGVEAVTKRDERLL